MEVIGHLTYIDIKDNMEEVKKEIEKIKLRNKRVELDKKWETCITRRILICILTFIVVVCYTYVTKKIDNILLSSLVSNWILLSTLSLKGIRKIWERYINNEK